MSPANPSLTDSVGCDFFSGSREPSGTWERVCRFSSPFKSRSARGTHILSRKPQPRSVMTTWGESYT